MQSLGVSAQPINRCARSSPAQPLGLPVSVARPWFSSSSIAASSPVIGSTAPRSLLPRRSLAARPALPAAGSASSPGKEALGLYPPPAFCLELASSASVSRIDHSLAGPRIVFAMAHQHHAFAPSLVARFIPQLKQLVSLSPFNETSQASFTVHLGQRLRRGCRCRHPPRAPFYCVQRTENARAHNV